MPVVTPVEEAPKPEATSYSPASVSRLRRLIAQLINEVEALDEQSITQMSLLENRDQIDFYEEVERFECALIRSALRRTHGHQMNAARLLDLNPSTLNAKIKQYRILDVTQL